MGDFLDDYLDGLSEGQRFNPLPYGPYYGTKDKRQWHLLADSEREQMIYEARMREEEESASASAEGGAGEGGSGPVPHKLILDRRFVPDAPSEPVLSELFDPPPVEPVELVTTDYSEVGFGGIDLTTDAVEYPTQQQAETFGTTTSPDGNVTFVSQDIEGTVVVATPHEISQTQPEILQQESTIVQPTGYITQIMNIDPETQQATSEDSAWAVSTSQYGDFPGYFNWSTGLAKPMYAIGGEYAIVFRALIDFNYYMGLFEGVNSWFSDIFYINTFAENTTTVYFDHGEQGLYYTTPRLDHTTGEFGSYYLYVDINPNETTEQIINNIESAYQSQGAIKYWSYGVVKVTE